MGNCCCRPSEEYTVVSIDGDEYAQVPQHLMFKDNEHQRIKFTPYIREPTGSSDKQISEQSIEKYCQLNDPHKSRTY